MVFPFTLGISWAKWFAKSLSLSVPISIPSDANSVSVAVRDVVAGPRAAAGIFAADQQPPGVGEGRVWPHAAEHQSGLPILQRARRA